MSQHHFFTEHEGKKTHVLMGWDRPLQGYFLVIHKESDRDGLYWSNLDSEESHPKTLQPFIDVLQKFTIVLPEEMIRAIQRDAEQNIGNRQVIHQLTLNRYRCLEGVDPSKESLNASFLKYGL